MKIIYVSGPYSNDSILGLMENVKHAEEASARLWAEGWAVICPHLNTRYFDINYPRIPKQAYIRGDLEILKRCDGIYMLNNWKASYGSKCEHRLAERIGLEILYE